MDDFDQDAYDDDLRAQNAVDDAKYDAMMPEQDEPPESWYHDDASDDEEEYGAGHTGSAEPPAYAGWSLTPAAQAAYPTPGGADPWSPVWGPGYSNEPPF